MQQIIAGQEINIENLPLEEEGKQELRMIQQQIKSQQPIPLPDNSSPSVLEDYQPPTNQPQKICASCSREIPIGQGYFRYKDEGTNICTNCYKCFTCQRSLENQQLIYHLDNNLTKANCADCH
ncbi:4162_t:CDS:1 [Funneliformis geosporum]|uniref:4162_t:CDS:1 n=1 Tax=Funneliformis geosporum TaxID=1117311 RepID=A0A9W4WSM8_9GLOM|nr:4162_t:CDS:1 [Funneliformis geosporum]